MGSRHYFFDYTESVDPKTMTHRLKGADIPAINITLSAKSSSLLLKYKRV